MHNTLQFMKMVKVMNSNDVEYRYKYVFDNNRMTIISIRVNNAGEIVEVYTF